MTRRTSTAVNRQNAAKKKKMVVLGVLLCLLAVMWLRATLKGKPGVPASSSAGSAAKPAPVSDAVPVSLANAASHGDVPVQWPAVLTRDPFDLDAKAYGQKQTQRNRVQPVFKLQGTILGEDPRALINGNTVGVGDTIDGGVVKTIEHGYVIVEFEGIEMKIGY